MNWFRNAIASLCDVVSAPVATRDALLKRLEGVCSVVEMAIVIVRLCMIWRWGATDFDKAMREAANGGRV